MPLLLFCRRGPTHDYLFCGRLAPVALAVPEGEAAEAARAEATALVPLPPQWSQSACKRSVCLRTDALRWLYDSLVRETPRTRWL